MTPPAVSPARAAPADRSRPRAPSGIVVWLIAAAACYVPQLLTKPGVVSDDTKTYLYLDPGRLLDSASSMWDPSVALGTVTHQNIGYLFPMGPFFWVFSAVHVPVWVAQRLWLGSILFAAAAGVLYLARLFGLRPPGALVGAVAYGLSPYVMQYAGRISVILLPFSGLPWLIAFMVRASRRGGWRDPALFALVVFAVSGINASSIIYVIAAPLLYLPYAVLVEREITWRQAGLVLAKTGLLSVANSLWWIAGLSVEAGYGVDILKYTESVEAASSAASSAEVIRGLGYWYFYNGDRLGLWTESSIEYTTSVKLLLLSYAVPVGAFVSAAIVRWRARAYFVLITVVGLVLSVGPNPFSSPTPLGALDKAFMTKTTAGEALRSTDRATPLVILGLAMLLGAGISALAGRLRLVGTAIAVTALAVVLAAAAPLIGGDSVIAQFSQPAHPPQYVEAAARYLNVSSHTTRVYDLPGNDFAAYDYGDTVDPIWPAVLDRPFAVHEQFIQGSMATANLLYAIDNPLQQGTMDWTALAPIARLMSAGDVVVEYDQQYARYNSPRPALLLHDLATVPPGLGRPHYFGRKSVNLPSLAMYDETYFDLPPGLPATHPLAVYPVSDPRPLVRADGLRTPVVLAGDNMGIVDAADVGLLRRNPTILFAGTLDTDHRLARAAMDEGAVLVLTDSNRKQAFEWNSLAENTGYTETASERPTSFVVNDPGFDLFPGAPTSSYTTSVLHGVSSVTASSYGTAFTLRAEERPANAIDGNLQTAWETEGTPDSPLLGQWWQVTTRRPVRADSVTLVQPLRQRDAAWLTNQYVTKVTLTFDGHHPLTVHLGPSSRTAGGEVIAFSPRRFRTLRVRIDKTNFLTGAYQPSPVGSSLVGFAEIRVGDLRAAQVISMPGDLLGRLGRSSLADRLLIVMTRDRVAPVPPRSDPEVAIVRQFRLPSARRFSLSGTARISGEVSDAVIDSLVGRRDPLVVSATSSSRMPGDLAATASATLDDSNKTVWMPGLGAAADVDSFLRYRFSRPVRVSRLALTFASDAEHSRPTRVLVTAGGVTRLVDLPPIPLTRRAGSVHRVVVSFPAVVGRTLELAFTRIAVRNTLSYETSLRTALPIGVATVSIPGVPRETLPARLPLRCRSDLLRIDGRPVPLEISGTTAAALQGGALRVSSCGSAAGDLALGGGVHLVQAADGALTGVNLDQLALDSAPGGAAMAPAGGLVPGSATTEATGSPSVRLESESSTSFRLRIGPASKPFVLTLGESLDKGWVANVDGGGRLGDHFLVDGFANGWLVSPGSDGVRAGKPFFVTIDFAPQKKVDIALVLSALAVLSCLVLLFLSFLLRRRTSPTVLPDIPQLSRWDGRRRVRDVRKVVAGVVLAGVGGFLLAGPVAAGIVAGVTLLALAAPYGGGLLRAGAAVAMAAGALAVVTSQLDHRFFPGGGWSSHFPLAASIVWVAAGLLAADAALEACERRRSARPSDNPSSAEGPR